MWTFTHVFLCISPVLSQTGSLSPDFDSHKLVPKMKHTYRSNASRSFWFVVLCRVVNPLIVAAGRPVDKTLSWLLTLQEPLISNLFFPLLAIFAFFNKHFQCFDQGHKIFYMLQSGEMICIYKEGSMGNKTSWGQTVFITIMHTILNITLITLDLWVVMCNLAHT